MASKTLFPPFTPLGFSVDKYIIPFSQDVNVDITVGFLYKNTNDNTTVKEKEFTAAANKNFKVYFLLCKLIITLLSVLLCINLVIMYDNMLA